LLSENNIASQIHYPRAMPFMPAYSYLNHFPEDFPNSYMLQNDELSLPIYPEMTNEQVDHVVKKVIEYVG
jgi:dTDP-4-amino-4,6-dideoxygalactose transaminase